MVRSPHGQTISCGKATNCVSRVGVVLVGAWLHVGELKRARAPPSYTQSADTRNCWGRGHNTAMQSPQRDSTFGHRHKFNTPSQSTTRTSKYRAA